MRTFDEGLKRWKDSQYRRKVTLVPDQWLITILHESEI
jgi:hypothetical protein